jgi:sulfonate transport system substrate-binding protein
MNAVLRLAAVCGLAFAPAVLGLQPAAAAEKLTKIAVTYVASPFNVPSIVMRANGYLDEAFAPLGLKPSAPEITSGAQQVQALAAGEVQIASVLGSASAILGQANGVDVKVIAAYSRNAEAYQILTRADGPATVAGLKGKTVAGPKGTTLNQLLAAALAKQGLKLSDVNYINMDLPSARAALLAGKVDAATLAGNNALAVEKAGGKILVSGKGLIDPTTVIGTRADLIKDHPEVIEAYLAAHRKALAFMAANPDAALKLAADDQKIDLADARRMLGWYDFSLKMTDKDVANLNTDQDFMIEAGMIKARIDVAKDLIAPIAFTLK